MMQWEQLVPEGHVRAARWRAAVGFVVAIAIGLIVLGLIGVRIAPQVRASSRITQAKQALVATRQQAVAVFIADKGTPPAVLPVDAAQGFRPDQVTEMIGQLLDSLSNTNALPQATKSLDPKAFWGGDWTPGTVAAVTGSHAIIVGFYVNEAAGQFSGRPSFYGAQPQRPQPRLARVFGLFHQSKGSWSFYCLAVPGAAPCGLGESIFPVAIPATLRGLTPKDAQL